MNCINIKGNLYEWERPLVMGIINVTPDSFFKGSRKYPEEAADTAETMLVEGASIVDIGGYSTRPGADDVDVETEKERVIPAIKRIRERLGDEILISIDTFRSEVASAAIEAGADIINDISGGDLDKKMFETIAELNVPYILMHSRGNAATMQSQTEYEDVTADVLRNLAFKIDRLHALGVRDIIVDPGFGFAKTPDQNYELLAQLPAFKTTGCPILAGLSRKTMVRNELNVNAEEALSGTIAISTIALMNGADILRVHDVKETSEIVKIHAAYRRNLPKYRHFINVSDKNRRKKPEIY